MASISLWLHQSFPFVDLRLPDASLSDTESKRSLFQVASLEQEIKWERLPRNTCSLQGGYSLHNALSPELKQEV